MSETPEKLEEVMDSCKSGADNADDGDVKAADSVIDIYNRIETTETGEPPLAVVATVIGTTISAPTTKTQSERNEPYTGNINRISIAHADAGDDEELEDGEIDDEGDEDNDVIVITPTTSSTGNAATGVGKLITAKRTKSKKVQPVDEDHMLSVEKAISNVLKKNGVEPQMPKYLVTRYQESKDNAMIMQRCGSPRRKRKNQRDEEKKEREPTEKKKRHNESPEQHAPIILDDDDDNVDDFEMLNVREGCPTTVLQHPEEKHGQKPRKMQLCKFYLTECCANKDQCTYMHSDFPCKYYYLGMECVNEGSCKFMHGEPLSERLHKILLKHLVSAPQTILGEFKRMTREAAVLMLAKRNIELCREHKVKNTNRRDGNNANSRKSVHQHQQQISPQSTSFYDNDTGNLEKTAGKPEKDRKSRWNENLTENGLKPKGANTEKGGPSYLNLSNLSGIMSAEHIEKLTKFGITNLEQVNQITLGQSMQIGIDFAEMREVQAKAKEKSEDDSPPANKVSGIRSVHMRGFVRIDYTQYLKGSNLAFDSSDADDDEEDDERLVIDEDVIDNDGKSRTPMSMTTAAVKQHSTNTGNDESKLSNASATPLNPMYPIRSFCNILDSNKPKGFKRFETISEDKTNRSRAENVRYFLKHRRERCRSHSRTPTCSCSQSRSRSRSPTQTRSQSNSPEASQSPNSEEPTMHPVYERPSIYDFNANQAEEDDHSLALESIKTDKDVRFLQGSSSGRTDLDLCLPFQAVTNYTPATEIDCSITSHLPMIYKLNELVLPSISFGELRRTLSSHTQTSDPRIRRILALPETRRSVVLPIVGRKLSNDIASPESDGSQKYYTPTGAMSGGGGRTVDDRNQNKDKPSVPGTQPRLDPCCAAAANAVDSLSTNSGSQQMCATSNSYSAAASSSAKIELIKQNSEWYRNLNLNAKIVVNEQLAHLTNQLKKFHQDSSPNKTFDFDIIFKSNVLEEILKKLGIFINDNGEIEHVDKDSDLPQDWGIMTPNLSLPPPQLEFLRRPPPLLPLSALGPVMYPSMTPNIPSLLDLSTFYPFSGNIPEPVMSAAGAFFGGSGLMGLGPPVGFDPFADMAQGERHFSKANKRNRRKPRNRRNFI